MNSKKGLTLIEVLVTSIILGFVLVGTVGVLVFFFNSYNRTIAFSQTQSVIDNFRKQLATDVRCAKELAYSTDNKKITITKVDNTTIVYEFADNKITVKRGSASPVNIVAPATGNTCTVEFAKVSSEEVRVDFSLTQKYKEKSVKKSFINNFRVRSTLG